MRTVLAFQGAAVVQIMGTLIRALMSLRVLASVITMFRSRVSTLIHAGMSTMVAVSYAPVVRRVRALAGAAMDFLVLALIGATFRPRMAALLATFVVWTVVAIGRALVIRWMVAAAGAMMNLHRRVRTGTGATVGRRMVALIGALLSLWMIAVSRALMARSVVTVDGAPSVGGMRALVGARMSPRVLASIVAVATRRVFTIIRARMGSMNATDRARVTWCMVTLICALMARIGGRGRSHRCSRRRAGGLRLQATTGIKSFMVAIIESPFTG
jgi:hypothetical protein